MKKKFTLTQNIAMALIAEEVLNNVRNFCFICKFISRVLTIIIFTTIKMQTKTLAFGSLGLCGFLIFANLLQEYMIQSLYKSKASQTKERMDYPNAFVLSIALFSWALAAVMNKNSQPTNHCVSSKFLYARSVLFFVSALTFVKAIYLTSFPFALLFKTCSKLLNILVVSLRNKSQQQKLMDQRRIQFTSIAVIAAMVIYCFSGQGTEQISIFGIQLLLISMICESAIPLYILPLQNYHQDNKITLLQRWQILSKYVTILSVVYSVLSLQIVEMATFFAQHNVVLFQVIGFGVLIALGDAHEWRLKLELDGKAVEFVKNARKILSVLLSLTVFRHQANILTFLSIGTVCCALCYNLYKDEKRRKFKQEYAEKNKFNISLLDEPLDITEQSMFKFQMETVSSPKVASEEKDWIQRFDMLKLTEEIFPPKNIIHYLAMDYEENPEDARITKGKEQDLMITFEQLSKDSSKRMEQEENLSTDSSKD